MTISRLIIESISHATNPDGNISYAYLEQRINDIPVFRGEIKAGFSRNGQLLRVINSLAPGLDYSLLATDFGDPRKRSELRPGISVIS